MKYGDIKNLEDLDKARYSLQRKIRRKEKELSRRTDDVKDSFTGVNLFGATLKSVSDHKEVPYDRTLLRIVRKLKSKISKL